MIWEEIKKEREKCSLSEISRQGYCHLITLLIKRMNRYQRDQNFLFATDSSHKIVWYYSDIKKFYVGNLVIKQISNALQVAFFLPGIETIYINII